MHGTPRLPAALSRVMYAMEGAKQRVAAYCRVSTDRDDQASSFDSQQRFFRDYIAAHPHWEMVEIFADEGLSGTETKHRAAFLRMIETARQGQLDLILTKEISRFARNTLDSIYYTRELSRYGVGVLFLNDGLNTRDGDAELRLTLLASLAQEESRRTSQRVKWGQKRRMEQGVVFGHPPLGYTLLDGKLTVDEEGAQTVRRIFYQYVEEGKGVHRIARELTEEGILPPRAAAWQSSVIRRLLKNEKYCGDLIQKKTVTLDYLTHKKQYNHGEEALVVLRDHHPPLISRELFERANRLLCERRAGENPKQSRRHPLSGKIRCGICGKHYVARYKPRTDGSIRKTWRCLTAVQQGKAACPAPTVPEERLLSALSKAIGAAFPDKAAASARFLSRLQTALATTSPILSDAVKRLTRLRQTGQLTEAEYAAACSAVTSAPPAPTAAPALPDLTAILSLWQDDRFLPLAAARLLDHITVNADGQEQIVLKDVSPVCTAPLLEAEQ